MFHSLRLAGAATLAVAVPVLAFAQPDVSHAPTPNRPITQPSFAAPAIVAPRPPPVLPSGAYVLTLTFLPQHNGATPGSTSVIPVALTHAGMSVTAVDNRPQTNTTLAGSVNATGALYLTGSTLILDGTATGASAQGVLSHPHPIPGGGSFTLTPATGP